MNTGIIHGELFVSAEMCKGPFVQQQSCVAAARGVKSLSDHVSGAVNCCVMHLACSVSGTSTSVALIIVSKSPPKISLLKVILL